MTDFWATITNAACSQRRNHVFKVGVEFLDLRYYCPSPEKKISKGIPSLAQSVTPTKNYLKSWGVRPIFLGGGPPRSPSGCAHSYWEF